MTNLYTILRVSSNVGQGVIEEAFNALIKKTADTEMQKQLYKAFDILGNPEKRKEYDKELVTEELGRKAILLKQQQEEKEAQQKLQFEQEREEKQREAENLEFKIKTELEERLQKEVMINERRSTYSGNFQDLLLPYIGKSVGINVDRPDKLMQCELISANRDFFSVRTYDGRRISIPYKQVLKTIESETGDTLSTGILFGFSADLFIEIFHMVIYKGAIGMGFSFPMDS